jgi:hypothetical protein
MQKRFIAGIMCSLAGLVVSYLGITRFRIVASKTVNGQVRWHFDSQTFFIISLVLGAAALAYTLWKWKSSRQLEKSAAASTS